jgi:branched-subunit amino acid transport protein
MSAHAKNPVPRLRYTDPDTHHMDKPPAISLVELALVGAAYLFALVAPTFVVPPGQETAPGGRVALAAGLTVLGVLVAVVVAMVAFRRTRNFSWLVIGVVPSFAIIAGAAILAGTKAFGS